MVRIKGGVQIQGKTSLLRHDIREHACKSRWQKARKIRTQGGECKGSYTKSEKYGVCMNIIGVLKRQ